MVHSLHVISPTALLWWVQESESRYLVVRDHWVRAQVTYDRPDLQDRVFTMEQLLDGELATFEGELAFYDLRECLSVLASESGLRLTMGPVSL